ncbi:MAG TPA: PilZ domain-containing protein [Terriglobales bacterium]|nr:PilZ domain-containing protein [Terriglobales bacterium]
MHEVPGRRKHTRYHCSGGVELRRSETAPAIFGNLSDISMEGCYVETVSTLPSGSEILFMMRVRDTTIRGRATIKASNHAVGMGLEFEHLATEDQQKLELLIGTLTGKQDMRPEEKRVIIPETPAPIAAPLLTPTRPVPTASMTSRPRPAAAPAPAPIRPAAGQNAGPMSQKIMRTINELNDLEQNLAKEHVDPRLIAQFHDAVGHVRQTAWTLQQWVEISSKGGDPFDIMPQLEAERMQMLTKLSHNVNADIDATSVTEFTHGISDLYQSIEGLYRRLRKILLVDDGGPI